MITRKCSSAEGAGMIVLIILHVMKGREEVFRHHEWSSEYKHDHGDYFFG